ncbi:MAG: S41 family peptidase [Tannerellaceae bacterium]|nr:S41 family peptidase [Tannerellaceae bacterium]
MRKVFFTIMIVSLLLATFQLKGQQNELPNREDRIYTLSYIWKELDYNFAFPETLKEVNIDSLYRVYLPKIESVETNYEYYRTLSEFMANFKEAHTRIYTDNRPDAAISLNAINFGDTVVIDNVPEYIVDKIPLKSQIIKINDIPVLQYIQDSVAPYISAGTAQWKFDKSVIELFYGKPLSIVKITLKTPEGEEREIEMTRDFDYNKKEEVMVKNAVPPIEIQILDGNIGYIKLSSFIYPHINTINEVFINFLPQLKECKGLIIDLRGNRGGTDQAWGNIANHLLVQKEYSIPGNWYSKIHVPSFRMWGMNYPNFKDFYEGTAMREINHQPLQNTVEDSLKLTQPLIVISGQHVASAAEDFLVLMKESGRATILGSSSVGCIGEPIFLPLPGDYSVMLCAKNM